MKEYLKAVLVPLLDNPESLLISESTDEQGKLLTVSVSKVDMGRVMGKEGETIKSVRRLIRAGGLRVKESVSVKVLEPEENR